jgi:hypothetical protein
VRHGDRLAGGDLARDYEQYVEPIVSNGYLVLHQPLMRWSIWFPRAARWARHGAVPFQY